MSALTHPSGAVIHMTGDRLNLTDMWKAAGADPSRQPAEWLRSADARRFILFLAETLNLGITQDGEVGTTDSHFGLVKATRGGKASGTEAHWQIGLAYAKYLSPEFHMWANTVVRERMEGKSVSVAGFDPRQMGGIMKSVIRHQIKEAITELAPQIIAAQLAADPRVAAVDAVPALQIAIEAKVPKAGRRPIVRAISNSLARHCEAKGHVIRRDVRGTKLYPLAAAHEWRLSGGDHLIRKLVADSKPIGGLFAIPGGKSA